MSDRSDRLHGWKAIGNHFGRDRTTAIRWARERQLPVRRTPGGKLASVYAFTHELEAWLEAENRPPADAPPASRLSRRRAMLRFAAASLITVSVLAVYLARPSVETTRVSGGSEILPADATTAAMYLEARQNWAERRSASIERAIVGFRRVIARDPGYAPAYAALADADILSREFGSAPDDIAFPRAKEAATVAVKLAPDFAGGHRALAFVEYWWDHDPVGAGRSFRRALQLAPSDAQTHHWYGTSLTDNGDFAAAKRELDLARVLNPESLAVRSDWAFVLYAGGDAAGLQILRTMAAQHPDFAASFDCMRYIHLAQGDFEQYFRVTTALARLRREPAYSARVAQERAAFKSGDTAAFARIMVANARHDRIALGDKVWPLSIASAVGDRAAVVAMLHEADSRHEIWGSASQRTAIASRWARDAEIQSLLARRAPPPME